MTGPRSQIFLGDYLRAIERLRPDDDATRQAIAGLLGLDFLASPTVRQEEKPDTLPVPEIPRQNAPRRNDDDEDPASAPASAKPSIESGAPLKSRLTPISTISRSQIAPELLEAAQKFPAVAEPEIAPQTPDPLFHPRWARGILTAALSTESPDGPVDIERLIESLSQREHLAELPRLSAPTMRRGLQLLVDLGVGMTPYASDVMRFQKEVRFIVGDDGVEVLRFDGSPLRGAGPGPRRTWKEYLPPSLGKPVLALTDLGINQPPQATASAREWLECAQLLRHAECPFVVFTPVSASRWPDDLVRAIHLIHWDRSTTAASTRRSIGRLLAVKK